MFGFDLTSARDRTLLGILCMIAFSVTAPVMDAFAKATPSYVPVVEILAFRFGIQAVLLVSLAWWLGIAHRPTLQETGLHLVRGLLILTATGFFFTAVRHMPLANAIAIFFVEPFILTLLGGLLLGEEVSVQRIVACLVGFAGAMLVIQPSFVNLGLVALYPLGTAFCFAFYMVMTRSMATRLSPIVLQGYTAATALLVVLPLLAVFNNGAYPALSPVWPRQDAFWMLLGVGLASTISHLFISLGLKMASASTIAPLQYLEIVAATALGWFVFQDFPNMLTWAGITVIVGAGSYVFYQERKLKREPIPAP